MLCRSKLAIVLIGQNQWRIQGRGLWSPNPSLFLDQTEARRAERNFLRDPAPAYLRVWMTGLLPSFSEGLDPPLKIDEKVIAALW